MIMALSYNFMPLYSAAFTTIYICSKRAKLKVKYDSTTEHMDWVANAITRALGRYIYVYAKMIHELDILHRLLNM